MLGSPRIALWLTVLALLAAGAAACAPKRMAAVATDPTAVPPSRPATAAFAGPPVAADGDAANPADAAGDDFDLSADDDGFGPAGEGADAGLPEGPPVPQGLPEDGQLLPADANAGEQVAALARTQVGKPYSWGATGPERFDCSGLAMYVYRQLGIALPRVSLEQAGTGVHIERSDLKPGDLVFFSLRRAFDHVGIFLGNNRFVHAPRRHEPVRVDNLDDAWWNRAYRGARRVLGGQP
jgi:murein DD-endopeptidase